MTELRWTDTLLVVALVLCAYLALLTPQWTPGGDSELFTAAARSIVRGEGYVYNGQPVRLAPPGWPLVLAGVFAISPTFLAGKLVNIACLTLTAALSHRVLLRLVSPKWALASAVLGGLLVSVYPLTTWLHSDPLFVLLGWIATLAAVRLTEATAPRAWTLWLAVLLIAGAAMPLVRYAAVFQWGVPLAILMAAVPWRQRGHGLLSRQRVIIALLLGTLVTASAFVLTLHLVSRYNAPATASDSPPTTVSSAGLSDDEHELPDILNNGPAQRAPFVVDRGLRLLGSGQWPMWLLWYPARFASGVPGGAILVGGLGLGLLGLLILAAVHSRHRPRWVWAVVVGYVLVLAFIWPQPNARYLVPVAPLVIAGVLRGCEALGQWWKRPRIGRGLQATFVFSLLLVNLPMLAIDVYVQHAPRYYATYEAGRLAGLVDAIEYLKSRDIGDRELAVSERYDNLGRIRFLKSGTREAVMLLDREVVTPFDVYSFEPGEIPQKLFDERRVLPGGFAEWARRKGIRYYLYQRPPVPWRLWHFRLPMDLHRFLGGAEPDPRGDGWVLYSADDGFTTPIDVPPTTRRITRVPGL